MTSINDILDNKTTLPNFEEENNNILGIIKEEPRPIPQPMPQPIQNTQHPIPQPEKKTHNKKEKRSMTFMDKIKIFSIIVLIINFFNNQIFKSVFKNISFIYSSFPFLLDVISNFIIGIFIFLFLIFGI